MGNWQPQPAGYTAKHYYAGYSDGWYGYPYGAGDLREQPDSERSYKVGYAHGKQHKAC